MPQTERGYEPTPQTEKFVDKIIGFTRSPDDGACFVNLKGFRQIMLPKARWDQLREAVAKRGEA